jgi:putative CocE/NonD family hydrolase
MAGTHAIERRIFEAVFRLPPRITKDIDADLDFAVPMPDGVELLADRWFPADLDENTPTVLVRTCYSRKAVWGHVARAYAERGFQTVVVNSRGTFGSGGGPFYAMHHERVDGLVVLDWVRAQPWYHGSMILAGASYLGYTQWAIAADAPDDVVAMHPHVTSARLAQNFMMTGAIELDTAARWSRMTAHQERPRAGARLALGIGERQLREAMDTLPINIIDEKAIGEPSPFYRDTVTRSLDDPFWAPWDRRSDVPNVKVPASFIAAWYDPFLVDGLRDYEALRDAGTRARLTVGPWTHASWAGTGASIKDTLEWGGMQTGMATADRGDVRLFIMGSNVWREFDHWPPREVEPVRWLLAADAVLTPAAERVEASHPAESSTTFHYDPADPTPSVGGRLLLTGAGRKDNRRLESRADVVTFTSSPLDHDLTIVGELSAEIWMSSTRPTWDLFVRLCDVDARGRSFNVADGLIRIPAAPSDREPDEPVLVRLDLSPTAQTFSSGHRLRIQISSGAHPRFARNLGSDEAADVGTAMFAADQTIYHDTAHPSSVTLPHFQS